MRQLRITEAMPLWWGGRGTGKELEFPLRLGLHCKGKLGALVAPTTLLA